MYVLHQTREFSVFEMPHPVVSCLFAQQEARLPQVYRRPLMRVQSSTAPSASRQRSNIPVTLLNARFMAFVGFYDVKPYLKSTPSCHKPWFDAPAISFLLQIALI